MRIILLTRFFFERIVQGQFGKGQAMQINGTVTFAGIVFEWEGDYDRHASEFDDFAIMVNGEDIDAENLFVRQFGKVEFCRLDEWIMDRALEVAKGEAWDQGADARDE
jgi:hypothetical protein